MVRGVTYNICGFNYLDDVVQDVWLKVWKGLDRFNGTSKIKTWIYRIAVNAALDHCRRSKKLKQETELQPETHRADDQDSGDEGLIYRELVQKGLEKLSDKHRAVIVLAELEELPLREVATILKTSEGTVKSRLHYARQEMLHYINRETKKYEHTKA